MPTVWIAAGAGALGGLVGIASLVAGVFKAVPFAFVLLAIALAWIQRRGTTADARDRARLRLAWKAAAWLLLAGGFALPLLTVPGLPITLILVIAGALLGALADALGNRIMPD
ncbi:MAG: hypothetical protein ABI553_10490 [Chloroflexota bacterium]